MNNIGNAPTRRALAARAMLCALLALGTGSALAGKITIEGKGTYTVKRALMPLADGSAVMHTTASTVASSSNAEGGVLFGECAGLSHVDPEGKAKSRVYCNFGEGGDDQFVMEADMSLESGKISITGGSGKYQGATGSGTLERTGENGGTGTYSYKFDITTP